MPIGLPALPVAALPVAALPMLLLRKLTLAAQAPGAPTLTDISLEIARGEITALLGPTGAGKSALLMLIAGHLRPTAGEIRVDGRLLDRTPPDARPIGLVPRIPTWHPRRNLGETLARPLRGRPHAEIETHVTRLLHRFDLAGLGPQPPNRLTSPQQHRAAIALAVAASPKLLLLDSPFTTLDRADRTRLQSLLRSLAPETTILHATTDPQEALALADRIALLDAGRLLQSAPAQQLYDAPASLRAAELLGPVNTLPGLVETIEDDLAIIRLDCGPTVEALPVGVTAGDRCIVAIRPERLAVAAVSADEMGDGAIPATVLEIRPLGDRSQLHLRVGESATIMVQRPAGAPVAGLLPGRAAAVAWQGYQARAFRTAS